MNGNPVPETDHRPASLSGNEILSIRLQPDGLSFAYPDQTGIHSAGIPLRPDHPTDALRQALSAPEWPKADFRAVKVCVPSAKALLIPAEADLPGFREKIASGSDLAAEEEAVILSAPADADKALLFAVCPKVLTPFRERYGETVSFFHPLLVNLSQPETKETLLQIDIAGGYASHTLTADSRCLFCDVFPGENPADILFQVNRIIVSNKIGTFRIVCSGEKAHALSESLSNHYRNVSVHPDGENRNLFFPFR